MFSATPVAVISSGTLNGVSSSLFISERTSESAETVCVNVFSLSWVPSVEPFLGSSPSLSSSPSVSGLFHNILFNYTKAAPHI